MCWVMPPYSRAATDVFRMASSRLVLPWSTCPITVTTGGRGVVPLASGSAATSRIEVTSWTWTVSGGLGAKLKAAMTLVATSRGIMWLTPAMIPLSTSFLMTSPTPTPIRAASSPTWMGPLTSRYLTGRGAVGGGGGGAGWARGGSATGFGGSGGRTGGAAGSGAGGTGPASRVPVPGSYLGVLRTSANRIVGFSLAGADGAAEGLAAWAGVGAAAAGRSLAGALGSGAAFFASGRASGFLGGAAGRGAAFAPAGGAAAAGAGGASGTAGASGRAARITRTALISVPYLAWRKALWRIFSSSTAVTPPRGSSEGAWGAVTGVPAAEAAWGVPATARRTRATVSGSRVLMWLRTGIFMASSRSINSLLVRPSSLASSWTFTMTIPPFARAPPATPPVPGA